MGVVLYTMVTGRMPFDDSDTKVLLQHIKRGVTFQKSKQQISEDCKDLIRSMLILDFRARITIEDIECHSWLTGKLRNSNESPDRNCCSTSTCGNTSQKQFQLQSAFLERQLFQGKNISFHKYSVGSAQISRKSSKTLQLFEGRF